MAHHYLWVLTRDGGISIDDVLAHCGSEDEDGKYCCLCIQGADCEYHFPTEGDEAELEKWLEEHSPLAGCSSHLIWDYAVIGGRANGAIATKKGQHSPVKPALFDIIVDNGTNSVRLPDLEVDQVYCVPFHIVNGAVSAEIHIDEFRIHAPESKYSSYKHRPQVKEYLATILNPGEVTVWGVDAHS